MPIKGLTLAKRCNCESTCALNSAYNHFWSERCLTNFPSGAVFDIARLLPRYGLDQKLSRKTWKDNSFWTISRIRVKPVSMVIRRIHMLQGKGLHRTIDRMHLHCRMEGMEPHMAF